MLRGHWESINQHLGYGSYANLSRVFLRVGFWRRSFEAGCRRLEKPWIGLVPLAVECILAAEGSCLRRRVESLELRVAVKPREVGVLTGPRRIAVT